MNRRAFLGAFAAVPVVPALPPLASAAKRKLTAVVVDPSGDEVSIIVVEIGACGNCSVLADRSCFLPPREWGRVAVDAYREFSADCIAAERHYGGAMVECVIREVDKGARFREVWAADRLGARGVAREIMMDEA